MSVKHQLYQKGAGLIEVMVALFVLAIGLLGFAGLQTEGITLGRQAYMHSQAAFMAQDIVERIMANLPEAQTGGYDLALGQSVTAGTNCAKSPCTTPSQLATWDKEQWTTKLAVALPSGIGGIKVTPTATVPEITVTIQYQLALGRLNPGEAAPAAKTYTYTLVTQ